MIDGASWKIEWYALVRIFLIMATAHPSTHLSPPHPALDTTTPINPNPGNTTRWLTSPEFMGRDELLSRIPEHIVAGHLLLTGEAGIGKTALMAALIQQSQQQRQAAEQQWIDGIVQHNNRPPLSYVIQSDLLQTTDTLAWLTQLNDSLIDLAQDILNQGLAQANTMNSQIGVEWGIDDLLKAVGLIKLQEEVDLATEPGTFIPKERIANALKSAMPVIKRFHFSSVNHCIKQLVQQLQDPWLFVASQLITPTHPKLVSAIDIAYPSEGSPIEDYVTYQLTMWQSRLQWIHQTLPAEEPRINVCVDHWEHLLTWPRHQRLAFFQTAHQWLQHSKTQGVHTLLSCRSETMSQALPASILAQFYRTCIVPSLSYRTHRRLISALFSHHPAHLDHNATDQLIALSQGNPYWTTMLSRYVGDRLLATEQPQLTTDWLQALGLTSATEILETSVTQIKLSNMPYEADALRVMACVVRNAGLDTFDFASLCNTIIHDQNLSRERVTLVMTQMIEYGLLTPNPSQKDSYHISNRMVKEYIAQTCQWIDTELTVDAQIRYLKKIIPLSVQSGELNRDKTQEVIALSTSTGQQELIKFLEETFTEHLSHPAEQVRITALNNLAMLHTETALDGILSKLADPSVTVQEYALRNLSYLCNKVHPPQWLERITAQLLPKLDTDNGSLRTLAYHTLVNLPINHHNQQMTAVYLKALSDQEPKVRELAIKQLQQADQQSAWVRHATLDALYDPSDDIRHQACLNLRHNRHPKVLEALSDVLESDANPTIRALAAKMIAEQGDPTQFHRLTQALEKDLDDNVQVTILRVLQQFPGTQTEQFMVQYMREVISQHPNPNTLLWACAQTLARIGQHPNTLSTLQNMLQQTQSPIVATALESAILTVNDRARHFVGKPSAASANSNTVIDVTLDS